MRKRIDDIRRKARASWWEDGVAETVAGLGVSLIGALGVLGYLLEGRIPPWFYGAFILLMVAMAFGIRKVVVWVKERWVWPRTGYSLVEGRSGRRILSLYVVALLLVGVAILFPSYTALLSGILGGVILLSVALYYGVRRFYVLAAFSFLLGVALQTMKVDGEVAAYILLTSVGVLEVLSGVFHYIKFRKEVGLQNEG